jgi:ParB-like chromosome segregation protein Spo0J
MRKQLTLLDNKNTFDDDLINQVNELIEVLIDKLSEFDENCLIYIINEIKKKLHLVSPFKNEPVDCVLWVQNDEIIANDYNPNSVAPPEMKLLERSIKNDGYTQPIVVWEKDNYYEVVDGFHRNRVGKESKDINERIKGYLPITLIKQGQSDRNDRIAATIRHNRARGKHQVDKMADIVMELKRRNWSDEKIGKELGMDPDEVLRLYQINGLLEMFSNEDFSMAWEAEMFADDNNEEILED